ncbi:prenyltransferase/squalene oxidase repeat-containing protein [Clostridium senegalense]
MNKNFKRGLAAFIIANSVLTTANIGVLNNNVFATERYAVESRDFIEKDYNIIINQCIETGVNHLINKDEGVWYNKDLGDWEALTISTLNKEVPSSYLSNITKKIETKDSSLFGEDGKFKSSTDCERTIIGIVAAGGDPRNIGGYNLMEDLCGRHLELDTNLFAHMFGLIALDCGNFKITANCNFERIDLVDKILEQEIPSGGWGWNGTIDSDTTTMAIAALSPYYNDDEYVKESVDKGLAQLSKMQNSDGEFASTWNPTGSSESVAQTIIALCSIGIDPTDCAMFTKNNKNLLDVLLTYRTEDGGFAHSKDDLTTLNGMSTEQALRALSSYEKLKSGKEGSIYLMKDFK